MPQDVDVLASNIKGYTTNTLNLAYLLYRYLLNKYPKFDYGINVIFHYFITNYLNSISKKKKMKHSSLVEVLKCWLFMF